MVLEIAAWSSVWVDPRGRGEQRAKTGVGRLDYPVVTVDDAVVVRAEQHQISEVGESEAFPFEDVMSLEVAPMSRTPSQWRAVAGWKVS